MLEILDISSQSQNWSNLVFSQKDIFNLIYFLEEQGEIEQFINYLMAVNVHRSWYLL